MRERRQKAEKSLVKYETRVVRNEADWSAKATDTEARLVRASQERVFYEWIRGFLTRYATQHETERAELEKLQARTSESAVIYASALEQVLRLQTTHAQRLLDLRRRLAAAPADGAEGAALRAQVSGYAELVAKSWPRSHAARDNVTKLLDGGVLAGALPAGEAQRVQGLRELVAKLKELGEEIDRLPPM